MQKQFLQWVAECNILNISKETDLLTNLIPLLQQGCDYRTITHKYKQKLIHSKTGIIIDGGKVWENVSYVVNMDYS